MEPTPPGAEPLSPQPAAAPEPQAGVSNRTAGNSRPWRRFRQSLVVVAALLVLLCLGGGAVAFMFYNRATTPDLNGPGPVSFEYLQAYFVERDDVRAAEYQCGDDSGLKSLRALRTEIDDRHKSTGIDFGVGIGGVSPVSQSGDVAVIEARIEISSDLNGVPRQEVEHWHLTLRNTNGWRVCTAQEVD